MGGGGECTADCRGGTAFLNLLQETAAWARDGQLERDRWRQDETLMNYAADLEVGGTLTLSKNRLTQHTYGSGSRNWVQL